MVAMALAPIITGLLMKCDCRRRKSVRCNQD